MLKLWRRLVYSTNKKRTSSVDKSHLIEWTRVESVNELFMETEDCYLYLSGVLQTLVQILLKVTIRHDIDYSAPVTGSS